MYWKETGQLSRATFTVELCTAVRRACSAATLRVQPPGWILGMQCGSYHLLCLLPTSSLSLPEVTFTRRTWHAQRVLSFKPHRAPLSHGAERWPHPWRCVYVVFLRFPGEWRPDVHRGNWTLNASSFASRVILSFLPCACTYRLPRDHPFTSGGAFRGRKMGAWCSHTCLNTASFISDLLGGIVWGYREH